MIVAGIALFVLFLRFLIEQGIDGFNWADEADDYIEDWFTFVVIGVTIVIVTVPIFLFLTARIFILFSIKTLLKNMNLVRRYAACETLGKINCICTNKTGTLTKNELAVTHFWQGEVKILDIHSYTYETGEYFKNEKSCNLLLEGCACNTLGTEDTSSATDCAILKLSNKLG
jgi:P-type Ca2+ transporter type 2B